jgi:alkanesulfonate monooxygenase SsuD/methylene tetrahydromethanopterin reductase-like flavin-dependent oxidoreductase (luciferase family)
VCADTDAAAERLASSGELGMVWFLQGLRDRPLPSVEEASTYRYDEQEEALRGGRRSQAIVGGKARVRERISELALASGADEVMILTHVHSHEARKRSYELVAEALKSSDL